MTDTSANYASLSSTYSSHTLKTSTDITPTDYGGLHRRFDFHGPPSARADSFTSVLSDYDLQHTTNGGA